MDDLNITQTLEGLATSQPRAPAIHVPGRKTLTYAHLGEQIRYVRERLHGWDIGRGDIVAGVIPSRPEMAVACLTVPSAATFAPLAPAMDVEIYAQLLGRMRPKAIVVPRGLDHPARKAARRLGITEIELHPDPSAAAAIFSLDLMPGRELHPVTSPGRADVAYILVTSGTTARRKLVPFTHSRVATFTRIMAEWCQITPADVTCHLMPLHHGHGLNLTLMVPLLNGSSLVMIEEADVDGFFDALSQYEPTWFSAAFTVHREILRRAPERPEQVARAKMRFLRMGSGQLVPEEIKRIEQVFRAPMLVALTATETLAVTHNPLPPKHRKYGSVGLPMENEVAIMDTSGSLCAAGEPGEIVVRGPLVFDGYLDDPELTARSFTGGWFHSGDLGRCDEDGFFYHLGRSKDVINRGGEKIAPAEVDTVIESVPGVREAACFGVKHPSLGEELVAAVVREPDSTIEEAEIIQQAGAHLSRTHVPRRLYFVGELPRTDNGKVRRSELTRLLGLDETAIVRNGAPQVADPAAVVSPLEAALAGLWASVLHVKNVGQHDDFFLLGGDSLRGARLLASVKAVFGVDVSIQSLFQDAATVAGMARVIEASRAGAAGAGGKSRMSGQR